MGVQSAEAGPEGRAIGEDLVNHPGHYNLPGLPECIDVIEGLKLPFHLAAVMKYIWRAGRKPDNSLLQDLKKAQWYLSRYITKLETNGSVQD